MCNILVAAYRGKCYRDEKSLPRRALEIFIFPVQLTKSRIDNLIRLILTLAILFAGFVARMEDTRLPKYVMFGELVGGAGCWGGQEKEWMGCFLDNLRASGINADQ